MVVPEDMIREFWTHWEQHQAHHDATATKRHSPVGVSGDDAKWSLAGAKIICVMLNLVLNPQRQCGNLAPNGRCRAFAFNLAI